MFKHITLLLVLVSFLASCSKDNPVTPTGETYTKPNSGTTYTFADYNTDTTSGQPMNRDTTVMTVVQTGMNFQGKTNVTKIISVNHKSTDTLYINYESNNDLSIFELLRSGPYVLTPGWTTLPTGSKATTTIPLGDTSYTVSGITTTIKKSLDLSYTGESSLVIKGQSTKTVMVKVTFNYTVTTAGVPNSAPLEINFSLAPSLGFLAKMEAPVSNDGSGGKRPGSFSTLFDYTLK